MSALKRPFHDKIEEYIIIVFFSLMVIITAVNVFSRYLLSFTFSWAEQVTRIFFVWITFAGISLAAGRSMHLRVSAITLILPKRWGSKVLFIGDFVAAIFGIFMSYKIIFLIQVIVVKSQTFSAVPWLPVWIMYLPGTLGMLGFSIRLIQTSIWPTIKKRLMKNNNLSVTNETVEGE
ncbi:MAG: TRAP transporter small permease [Clostridia bacterium]